MNCQATTASGAPCRRSPTDGGFCASHAGQTKPRTGEGHITANASVCLLFGFVLLLGGFTTMSIMGSFADEARGDLNYDEGEFMDSVGRSIFFGSFLLAAPAIVAGVGLIRRAEYGRVFAMVTAVLAAFTGIGLLYTIYAFWSLTLPEVAATTRGGAHATA